MKLHVYQTYIFSNLFYGSEAWSTDARLEQTLNIFHLRCLRRILGISCQDMVPHTQVLERASCTSICTLWSHQRVRWLGHVHRMVGGLIPKDVLYGERVTGTRTVQLADHIFVTKTHARVIWIWQALILPTGWPPPVIIVIIIITIVQP